jgi:hypothetical protein
MQCGAVPIFVGDSPSTKTDSSYSLSQPFGPSLEVIFLFELNLYLGIVQQALLPNGVYSPTAVYWNNLNR